MQKQIATQHCQPEQIAEYQKKQREKNTGQSKYKELMKSLVTEDKEAMEKSKQIQAQEKQTKLQKTQNIILGGILFSLLVLVGMGVWWIWRKRIDKKELGEK